MGMKPRRRKYAVVGTDKYLTDPSGGGLAWTYDYEEACLHAKGLDEVLGSPAKVVFASEYAKNPRHSEHRDLREVYGDLRPR